jgi:hypothetical protein
VEVVELEGHPWFVASQFHPEFRSKPDRPHPLFREFIRHALLKTQKALDGELASKKETSNPHPPEDIKVKEGERTPTEVA